MKKISENTPDDRKFNIKHLIDRYCLISSDFGQTVFGLSWMIHSMTIFGVNVPTTQKRYYYEIEFIMAYASEYYSIRITFWNKTNVSLLWFPLYIRCAEFSLAKVSASGCVQGYSATHARPKNVFLLACQYIANITRKLAKNISLRRIQ